MSLSSLSSLSPPKLHFIVSALFLFVFFFGDSDAAHSRRRVTVRTVAAPPRYDRSITTFDPSGRLLQVEYGLQAARRGSSYLVATTALDDGKDSAIFIIVAGGSTRESSVSSSSSSSFLSSPFTRTVNDNNISYNKVFRIDDHLWLVTSGLVGDARTLAAHMRITCQRHRLSLGVAPRVEQAARQAAALQHELTRTGGARPLGCTTMVLGVDAFALGNDPTASQAAGSVRVVRTDPGGILEDCWYYAGGRDGDKLLTALATLYNDDNTVKLDHSVLASKLTKIMAEATGQKKLSVDVWVLRPNPTCRGNMEVIQFANVRCDKQDENLFASLLTKSQSSTASDD